MSVRKTDPETAHLMACDCHYELMSIQVNAQHYLAPQLNKKHPV